MPDKPILITGAAGFIGSHLAEALLARGERIIGLDNFDPFYPRAFKEANLREIAAHPKAAAFEFVEGDITDAPMLAALCERARPEGIIHIAARAGVRPSIADPTGYAHVNLTGTASVMEAARKSGCSRLVIASSSSVYGNNPKTPFAEDDAVEHPISPYAATKRANELMGHTHWHLTKMPTAMLRFFTVFGPRQRPDLAIRKFLARVGAGESIEMFGDGSTSRDYTFIDDIVAGVIAAYDRIPAHGYRVWNLGGNHPISLAGLIEAVGATVGKTPIVERRPMQAGDVERTWADLARSTAELGYRPTTSVEEGLARQWAWMREHGAV
ncbi:MAG: GDP-mannose 4,6-dehydratase [Phycisphaerales bacterium]